MKTRQKPRKPIEIRGHCRSMRGMQWEVALSDLSEGGCGLPDPRGQLKVGETLKLYIGGTGPHNAHVRWRDQDKVGIAFVRPLAPVLLDQLHSGRKPAPASVMPSGGEPASGLPRGPMRMVC